MLYLVSLSTGAFWRPTNHCIYTCLVLFSSVFITSTEYYVRIPTVIPGSLAPSTMDLRPVSQITQLFVSAFGSHWITAWRSFAPTLFPARRLFLRWRISPRPSSNVKFWGGLPIHQLVPRLTLMSSWCVNPDWSGCAVAHAPSVIPLAESDCRHSNILLCPCGMGHDQSYRIVAPKAPQNTCTSCSFAEYFSW